MKCLLSIGVVILFIGGVGGVAGYLLMDRVTDTSNIYSGWYYNNDEYGFQMELPESWQEVKPSAVAESGIEAEYYFEKTALPTAYFNLFITSMTAVELGLAGLTLLDQSDQYYFYYSAPTQQADCSLITNATEQADCTELQNSIIQDIQNGIIKTFTVKSKLRQ